MKGYSSVATLLIEANANVNTALILCIWIIFIINLKNEIKILLILLIASWYGHSSAVTSLIQANASVNIKNNLGRTALSYGKSSLIKLSTV